MLFRSLPPLPSKMAENAGDLPPLPPDLAAINAKLPPIPKFQPKKPDSEKYLTPKKREEIKRKVDNRLLDIYNLLKNKYKEFIKTQSKDSNTK